MDEGWFEVRRRSSEKDFTVRRERWWTKSSKGDDSPVSGLQNDFDWSGPERRERLTKSKWGRRVED